MHLKLSEIPRPAFFLGVGGLLPFFLTAIIVWYQPDMDHSSSGLTTRDFALQALGGYGAVILSFLGGIRWGSLLEDNVRLRQWTPLTLSVLPSLIGWCSLLLPPVAMLVLLIAGFTAQYTLDVMAVRRHELPVWFGRLRLMLSCGAVLSLVIALVGVSLN